MVFSAAEIYMMNKRNEALTALNNSRAEAAEWKRVHEEYRADAEDAITKWKAYSNDLKAEIEKLKCELAGEKNKYSFEKNLSSSSVVKLLNARTDLKNLEDRILFEEESKLRLRSGLWTAMDYLSKVVAAYAQFDDAKGGYGESFLNDSGERVYPKYESIQDEIRREISYDGHA